MLARRAHHSPRAKTVQCPRRPACRAIFSVGRSAFCIPFPPPRRTSLRACASAPLPSSASQPHTLLNPFLNLLFIHLPSRDSHARPPPAARPPILHTHTPTNTPTDTLTRTTIPHPAPNSPPLATSHTTCCHLLPSPSLPRASLLPPSRNWSACTTSPTP